MYSNRTRRIQLQPAASTLRKTERKFAVHTLARKSAICLPSIRHATKSIAVGTEHLPTIRRARRTSSQDEQVGRKIGSANKNSSDWQTAADGHGTARHGTAYSFVNGTDRQKIHAIYMAHFRLVPITTIIIQTRTSVACCALAANRRTATPFLASSCVPRSFSRFGVHSHRSLASEMQAVCANSAMGSKGETELVSTRVRSYEHVSTASRPISEVKHATAA
jgi:hypothetical protein